MKCNNNESFNYTYSAKEQEEVKRIRNKYAPKKEEAVDKMQLLRKLDASVYKKATIYSIVIGTLGALIMGYGMSCCMVWADAMFIPGIIIGILGIVLICLAYPIYNRTLKKERKRIAPEIIRLSDELIK